MENSPDEFLGVRLTRDVCGVRHKSPADALIAFGSFDIQIGDVQRARRAIGIVTEMIKQIANDAPVFFSNQPGKSGPLAKAIAQIGFGGQAKFAGVAQCPQVIGELPGQGADRKGVLGAGRANGT